jgi:signal transduction histidine kinase
MDAEKPADTPRKRRLTPALEREFRASNEAADARQNFFALAIVLPLYALYALVDAITLANPREAVPIRIAFAALAAAPALAIRFGPLTRHHDLLAVAAVTLMGLGVNVLIWRDPGLEHNYYVALIQGGIFVSFLARLTFLQSVCVLLTFLGGFSVAVFDKEPTDEAVLQVFILITMFSMCAFGIHLMQTLRRRDFLKSKKIAEQNRQLNELLAEAQEDNARKVAAMNLLVHFVKTPIHQIVGFSDVIKRRLESPETAEGHNETLQSAAFIQTASRDLSRSVSKLLSYYRLDEKAAAAPDLIELDALILDHLERLSATPPKVSVEKVAIVNRVGVVGDLIQTMIDRYVDDQEARGLAEVRLERTESAATLMFVDGGPVLSDEDFSRLVKPLDKLDHYLTANGSTMLLGLRTVARAAELCGGALTHRRESERNLYFVSLPDLAPAAALNATKVA